MPQYVCVECAGEEACTLYKPDDRMQFPIMCTFQQNGKTLIPRWIEVPSEN